MGLIAYVYRDASGCDCTNNGITSRFDKVLIVNCEGPFKPSDDIPQVELVKGYSAGTVRAVPVELKGGGMMGGNYIATCDSRFSELCESLTGAPFYGAVAVHDRVEGAAWKH